MEVRNDIEDNQLKILKTIETQKVEAIGKLNASAHAFPDLDKVFGGDIFSVEFLPSYGDGSKIQLSNGFDSAKGAHSFVCQTSGVYMVSYSLNNQLAVFAKAELQVDGKIISG